MVLVIDSLYVPVLFITYHAIKNFICTQINGKLSKFISEPNYLITNKQPMFELYLFTHHLPV